jgi:hypothetical protein
MSTGGAEDADSDHKLALVIDETPQDTKPHNQTELFFINR